jgi:hypothetical protein
LLIHIGEIILLFIKRAALAIVCVYFLIMLFSLEIYSMRVAFHLFILMLFCGSASAQSGYWQQDLRYTIKAELSEADQSIRQ